jgi:uncharacterized repeat protein (TIGR01451 family)
VIYLGSQSGDQAEPLIVAAVLGPHLLLTKTVFPATYSRIGDILTYTLVATNNGTDNLTGVTISDPGLTDVTSNPAQPTTLLPGAALTVTGTHTVTQSDLATGSFNNAASATGQPPQGAPPVTSVAERGTLRAPSVGGEDGSINKAHILAPWLGAVVLILGGVFVTGLLLRRRNNR